MVKSLLPSYRLTQSSLDTLADAITKGSAFAPRVDAEGFCRLQPLSAGALPDQALSSFVPLKKMFLPPREKLWSFQSGQFSALEQPEPFAVVGVPLCDLQALWYLDQVFAEDLPYQKRRTRSLVVATPCEPLPECRCDPQLMPVAGDLFLEQKRAWALSPAGDALLRSCGADGAADKPLPWPTTSPEKRPLLTEEQLRSSSDAAIWTEAAQSCLACGACSVVCPTCYCFDLLDETATDGSVTRNRRWDNCFFAEHAKVAGGHDFRPGSSNRLHFRLEHKFFGFGELQGQNSCVGCGRCRKVCPVDIDLDQIAAKLGGEELS
ncbi:MAG: 4Fe-4S dicluster domain-containing protein [Desulfuromonadales bacterium]|nr:4Fe-4S dicluster domain-containing protein [Desulfuromonadales bacterium]